MKNRDQNKQEITTWRKQILCRKRKLKANKQNKGKKKKTIIIIPYQVRVDSISIKQEQETIKGTLRQLKNKKLEILNIYDNISGKLNE